MSLDSLSGIKCRLIPVSVNERYEIPKMLTFYMGKNTPARKQYIMEHMIDV